MDTVRLTILLLMAILMAAMAKIIDDLGDAISIQDAQLDSIEGKLILMDLNLDHIHNFDLALVHNEMEKRWEEDTGRPFPRQQSEDLPNDSRQGSITEFHIKTDNR